MRYLVVGAGALGGYFGGRLLEAGCDVTFLLRPRRAEAMARTGLVVTSRFGDISIAPVPHVLPERLASTFDVVIVACKAYDLAETMESFAPAVGAGTAILPLLNGMRHLDDLQARFGSERVLGGLCLISAALDDEGRIQHLNDLQSLVFGELGGGASERVEAIQRDFSKARFDGRSSPMILQEMWEKWVFIATVAGLTCLMRASVGDVIASGGSGFSLALFDQCRAIAAANGFTPRPANVDRVRAMVTAAGSAVTASMLKDMERGARVEADHVIGDLLRRAPQAPEASSPLATAYLHLQAYQVHRAAANS